MELHTFYAALSGDLAGALARMGTSERLLRYLHMLPRDEAVQQIRQVRLSPEEICGAAHRLRGVAGMLGLTLLQSRAQAVEMSAGSGESVAATRLGELEDCLRRTLDYVGALNQPEAHLRPEERGQWARDLGGMPGKVCVVHAETGQVIWGEADAVPEASEVVWDAAWLGRAGQEQNRMVWPCRAGYAFCHREGRMGPDVLSILGHDVRTPLHVIRSMISLALHSGGDMGQIVGCLERIEAAERHLEAIVSGMGAAREPDAEVSEVFSLLEALERSVMMMRPEAAEKDILLESRFAIGRQWVEGNRGCLSRVIMNLLTNAVKNTAPGGHMKLCCQEAGPGVYDIVVEDSGAGMSASFVRRAFEPYVQGSASAQGQGLGLHIVRRLVSSMQGEVFVRSRPGSGTAVTVRLPLRAADVPVQAESLAGVHVLLVDDHTMSAQASAAMLESLGAQVTLARSGAESLRCARGQDCVLMDMHLPDMSGGEAAQRLHLRYPAQPILAFTADDSLRPQALACGMQGVVPKPVGREELAGAILRQLHRAG